MVERGLVVEVVENGFIVQEDKGQFVGRKWAFEKAESLSYFIEMWAHDNTKVDTDAGASKT